MKILQVVSSFPPAYSYGGAVKVSYEVSKELARRGHDVTVFTTDTLDSRSRINEPVAHMEGIEVYRFRNISNNLAAGNLAMAPGMALTLKNIIQKFDVVHIHEYRSFQTIAACHYAEKYNIPYVLQPHGSLPRIIEKQILKKIYDTVWGNKTLKDAEGVIALTSVEAEQAVTMGVNRDKIHIIPNGADLSQWESVPSQGGFRAQYNIPSDMHVILYLGRLHSIKGIDLLIRAFEIVSKERDDCILVVVGPDNGSLSGLEKITKGLNLCDKVLFTGPLYGKDKSAVYYDSDIYVLPSHYEAFPMTVLEAWAFRKPVIVTENCGIKDLVHGSGQVVQPNPQDLASALQEYLQQDSLRHRHGQNGYNKLYESLSIQTTVDCVEDLYREVIKSRGIKHLS
jgi:glycosyltransferase involved in cell wall biosynthesis